MATKWVVGKGYSGVEWTAGGWGVLSVELKDI